jgi:protein-S-isoprenylcysteine O-methyltransferase Ste14
VRLLLHIAWVIGSVYATIPVLWLAIHPFVGYWRRRRGPVMPLIGMIWLAFIAFVLLLSFPWRDYRLYFGSGTWGWWSWLGWLILFALGLALYRKVGSFGLARVLGQAEVRPEEHEQKLITTGIHGRVRHPIYLAHWIMLTAWTVGAGTVALLAMWLFASTSGIFLLRAEERELQSRFGAGWEEYTARVPMILPRF